MSDDLEMFEDIPVLTREQAEGEFEDITLAAFELIARRVSCAIGDLAMDIGSGNERASVLLAKTASIIDELVSLL